MTSKGFTLIELVVVIVLIGILAGVALPRLFQSVSTAGVAVAQGTVMTMNSSLSSLQADYLLNPNKTIAKLPAGITLLSTGIPSVAPSNNATCSTLLNLLASISSQNIDTTITTTTTLTTSGSTLPWIAIVATTSATGQAVLRGNLSIGATGCFYYHNTPPNSGVIVYYSDAFTPNAGYYTLTSSSNPIDNPADPPPLPPLPPLPNLQPAP